MLESPEMFGSLPLDPNNDWVKLSKLVPWREFDVKYAENFRSKKGQRAIDSRMALGAVLIKPAYKAMSDEDITKEIAMNPYLQYFLGLHEYRYECPFDPSMMTRFRQRITPKMLAWSTTRSLAGKRNRTSTMTIAMMITAAERQVRLMRIRSGKQQRKRTKEPSFWMRPAHRRTSAFLQIPPC